MFKIIISEIMSKFILVFIIQSLRSCPPQSGSYEDPVAETLKKPFQYILDQWHEYNSPEFRKCNKHYCEPHQHIPNLHLKLISVHELSFLRDRRCSCKDVPQGCYVGEGPCNHDKECTGVIIILNIVAFKETTKEIPLYSKLSKRRITCNFYIKVACIYFWKKCIQSRYD